MTTIHYTVGHSRRELGPETNLDHLPWGTRPTTQEFGFLNLNFKENSARFLTFKFGSI